jgi:DNA invertase Pin-like site-specific DNA recombinase
MDGYTRVSRRMGRHGEGYISPTVQREAIQRWADYRGIKIVAWHFDEDGSGGTQNRPGLRDAMARVLSGETDGIACWRLNRFALNVGDAINDIKRIEEAGAHLALVEEQIDPTGPFGRFLITVLLAVATLERDNAVAGFEEAKQRAVKRGAYVSRTPFGFQRNEDGTISPHPDNAKHVTEAFRLAAQQGLHAAMDYLKLHVRERRWTTTKARRLLAGRSYLGETRNGDLVQADTHEALVSRAIWEAAQTSSAKRRPADDFPLTGLLRCANCGQGMTGSRGGKGQRTYRCSGTQAMALVKCDKGTVVTAERVESYARDVARTMVAGLTVHVGDDSDDELSALERAIEEAEAELDAFAGDLTMRRALKERYHQHLEARSQAVTEAQSAYREHARQQQSQTILDLSAVESDDSQLFSALLRGLFEAIRVRSGRGLKIEARVDFVPHEGDGPAGVAATQHG